MEPSEEGDSIVTMLVYKPTTLDAPSIFYQCNHMMASHFLNV